MKKNFTRILSIFMAIMMLMCIAVIPASAVYYEEDTSISWALPCKWKANRYIYVYGDAGLQTWKTNNGYRQRIYPGDDCTITRAFSYCEGYGAPMVLEMIVPGIPGKCYLPIVEVDDTINSFLTSWYWESDVDVRAKSYATTYYGKSTSSARPGWVDAGDHCLAFRNGSWVTTIYPISNGYHRLGYVYDPNRTVFSLRNT